MTPPARRARVLVTSDLHLFADRSTAHQHVESLVERARGCDALILNGDIFDFHWSTLGDPEATAAAAERWLRELTDALPTCRCLYLLGNHDARPELADACARLASAVPHFAWSPDFARLGDVLFTHGDLLQGRSPRRERTLDRTRDARPPWQGRIYAGATTTAIVRIVGAVRSRRRSARRLARNLARLGDDEPRLVRGVERVCVGHSHLPFNDLAFGGFRLFNSGATVRGVSANTLELAIESANEDLVRLWPDATASLGSDEVAR